MSKSAPDKNTTLFPLSSSQNSIFFLMKFIRKDAFNLAATLNFEAETDRYLLYQATTLVVMRNRSSFVRICRNKGKVMQYFTEQLPESVKVFDFTGYTPEKYEKTLLKWVSAQMTEIYNKPLLIYRMVKRPDGCWSVFICASHLIYDGFALADSLVKIMQTYNKLVKGEETGSWQSDPMVLYNAEWEYLKSGKNSKDAEYLKQEIFDTEPYYTSVIGGDYGRAKGKRYGKQFFLFNNKSEYIFKKISPELTANIFRLAAELSVSPEDIYMVALRNYLAGMNDSDDVMLINNLSRRFNQAQRNAGGNAAGNFYYRSRFDKTMTAREAIIETRKKRLSCYRHCRIMPDSNIVDYLLDFAPGRPRTSMYFPTMFMYQDYDQTEQPAVPYNIRPWSSSTAFTLLYFMVLLRDSDGGTPVNYAVSKSRVPREVIDRMHEKMVKILEKMTLDPDAPLGDVIALSKD